VPGAKVKDEVFGTTINRPASFTPRVAPGPNPWLRQMDNTAVNHSAEKTLASSEHWKLSVRPRR
jgi:hypothetical protein